MIDIYVFFIPLNKICCIKMVFGKSIPMLLQINVKSHRLCTKCIDTFHSERNENEENHLLNLLV